MKYERGSFITVGSRDTLRGLHPTAQALYMWLSSYANETGNCFPSRKTLARDAGCSENSVDRMLELLCETGLLQKKHQKRGDVYTSNLYTVLVVGGSPSQQPPSPHTEATVPPDVRTNSNHLTQTNEDRADARPHIEISEDFTLEEESGGRKSPRISGDKLKAYNELIAWSEKERGFTFPKTTILIQYKAFKLANENKIPRERLVEMWEEMSGEKFWQKAGFDWMNVVQQCLKKPV